MLATHSSIVSEKSHGERSLAGYSPWGCVESDMMSWLNNRQQQYWALFFSCGPWFHLSKQCLLSLSLHSGEGSPGASPGVMNSECFCRITRLAQLDSHAGLESLLLDLLGLSYWHHAILTPTPFLSFILFSCAFLLQAVPFKTNVKWNLHKTWHLNKEVLKGESFSFCLPILPFPTP